METMENNCNGGNKKIDKQAKPSSQKMEIMEDEIDGGNKNIMANSPSEAESSSVPGQSSALADNQTAGSSAEKSSEKKLNPLAKDWNFPQDRATLDDRSVYLTFSNGSPFNEYEIACFFNRKFGRCVERVFLHCGPNKDKAPLTGRVIFRFSCVPAAMLGKSGEAKFTVNNKPLWCKRFVPRKCQKQK